MALMLELCYIVYYLYGDKNKPVSYLSCNVVVRESYFLVKVLWSGIIKHFSSCQNTMLFNVMLCWNLLYRACNSVFTVFLYLQNYTREGN